MVRKKGKGWKVIIEAGYDKETGKRRRICRTAPTKREAVELESRIRHEVATGAYVPDPGISVGEFLDRWLADVASVRGEKGLSPVSVGLIYRTLRGALNVAMAWKLIRENPARGVHLPRGQAKRQQEVLSLEQLELLFSALKPAWLDLVISIAVTTGLRRGEIAGLRWSCVDLAERLIGVERQRVRVGTEILEGTLKTKNSIRGVPLSERVRSELVKERARQDTLRNALRESYLGEDFVIVSPTTRPIDPTWISNEFRKLCRRIGIPTPRLHDLRHT
jgi:integrase